MIDMTDRDAIAAQVMDLFHELSHRVRRRGVERLEGLELSFPEAIAIHQLGGPLSMGGLADRLSCDASYVTGLIDRLEERQLAERKPDPHDRRDKQVVLTEQGREMRRDVEAGMYERSGLLQVLENEELLELARILEKILSSP
jgi:DNA-binding MarR family transcriptional regulator